MPGPIITDRTSTVGVERWQKADSQTVTTVTDAGQRSVDHAASANANLRAASEQFGKVFKLDRFESVGSSSGVMGPALKVVLAPWLIAAEASELVTGPAKASKNVADAIAHKFADWF